MAEELCEICKENEIKNTCEDCGKKLCADCTKEFAFEETHPGYRIKGQSFIGATSEGTKKKKLCAKCFEDVEPF
jgi:hypothetical protein